MDAARETSLPSLARLRPHRTTRDPSSLPSLSPYHASVARATVCDAHDAIDSDRADARATSAGVACPPPTDESRPFTYPHPSGHPRHPIPSHPIPSRPVPSRPVASPRLARTARRVQRDIRRLRLRARRSLLIHHDPPHDARSHSKHHPTPPRLRLERALPSRASAVGARARRAIDVSRANRILGRRRQSSPPRRRIVRRSIVSRVRLRVVAHRERPRDRATSDVSKIARHRGAPRGCLSFVHADRLNSRTLWCVHT